MNNILYMNEKLFKFKKSKSISLYFVHLFDLLKKSSEKINQTLIFYAFLKNTLKSTFH